MGRILNNVNHGPGLLKRLGRIVAASVAAVATLAGGMLVAGTANAATAQGPGYWFNPFNSGLVYAGHHGFALGVQGTRNGRPAYCIQIGVAGIDTNAGTWADATDATSKVAAYMVDKNAGDMSDLTQAAVAYAIHEHLDEHPTWWASVKTHQTGLEGGDWNTVATRAAQLWQDAADNMPANIRASYKYTQGERKGTYDPGIRTSTGAFISGLAYTLKINGPAVFDATGTNTYTGTTTGAAEHIAWTATGNGSVSVTASHKISKAIKQSAPGQDLFAPTDPETTSANITFNVRRDFQPTVSTQVGSKIVPRGARVSDRVTSGIKQGDEWANGVNVTAKGYYYTLDARQANGLAVLKQNGNEKTADYLNRVAKTYGNPAATADATFSGPGQTQAVTAKNADGTDYVNPQDGRIGTWVWTILKNEQTQPDYITADYVDPFGQTTESDIHKTSPNHDSTVLEQYTGLNKDIMDTITIGGLPQDYGQFNTNQAYGFGGDVKAKIRVWWAGSGTGDRTQDEKFKPNTQAEPAADANHRLLGEWEVPAGNGTYKVGGGRITFRPANAGKAQTVAEDVNITATDASQTGYYVFVYDFPGSDRASAFKSAYNDPWERSFVEKNPATVDLTSNVSAIEVGQGEEFHDVAHINGKVSRGSYVLFTAYDAVPGRPDTSAAKLLDAVRVDITDEQADASDKSAFDVVSPTVKTDKTGNVYWQAELYNADGEPLATHELGIESETTIVRGVSVTTKVSSEQVYVNQKFHDTAIIDGKVGRGSYVVFDAYGPCDDEYTDGAPKLLDSAKVAIPDGVADKSAWNTSFTIDSPDITSKTAGNVYWQAKVYRKDGLLLAQHDLGIAGETVKVMQPTITTQVTKTTVHPGEEFADKATIEGKVERGSYVTFDAYEPVSGDPDTTAGKLLDSARVDITDEQADRSDKEKITVTSPKTKTDNSGSVYWKATLHAKDGTAIATHDLGLPSETVYVAPGGYLSSQAQVMGATGEQLYDQITVYNESDGHEGNGNSNPSGMIGSIPAGSHVTVEAYRQDGNNTASKNNLIGTHDFPIDISQMRDGKLTFKAQDKAFTMDKPGMVYWVATLKTANGAVLDKAVFGESGDQHGTGVESQERTPVQQYDTTISKKWFSVNSDEYAEKTVSVYDVLKQTAWKQADGDVAPLIGQTAPGTQYQFEVWQQGTGDQTTDTIKWTGKQWKMPQSKLAPNDPKADSVWQKMKSETFTIGKDWTPGAYYVRVLVTNPDVDNTVEGKEHVVKYTKARDEAETFRVFKVTSTSAEPLWLDNQKHVQDILHVSGTMPKSSSYQVEIWTTDDKGDSLKKVAESAKLTLDKDVTDADIKAPVMDNPGKAGSYQFRFRIWSPDDLGGDPDIDPGNVILDDSWKQGDGYAKKNLIFDGRNVPSEHFEIVKITTRVAGTANIHTWKGGNYVNVTHPTQIGDHADIEGRMLDGYKLGFELYRQDAGEDASKDTLAATIQPTDLHAAQTALDSALASLDKPGDYYWVWVFQKADGTAFRPDGETQVRSGHRIKEESLHAARITTTTAKWTAKGGETRDVALIEGCVPDDAIADSELHEYETGDKVAETGDKTLKDLGYKTCANGDGRQTIESDKITVPDAKDYYFVESVRFPNEDRDHGFHRGDDRVPYESTRSIDATTETYVEQALGTAVSDRTDLLNIKYSKSDGKDIRDDLTGPLTASWDVWKQDAGDDPSKDVKIATLADKDRAVRLESGQTTVDSPEWKPSQTGVYYFRVIIRDENGRTLKYGAAREPSETIRIINARSATDEVIEEGGRLHDRVTINGPVVEGTMIGWSIYNTGDGAADADTLVEQWNTPQDGAYVITAEDAAKAAKDGKITITSPNAYEKGKAGDRPYFVFSLTSPRRGKDGRPVKPAKDKDGVYTMDHLMLNGLLPIGSEPQVDGDGATPETVPAAFYTDPARTPSETSSVIKITTTANTHNATVGDKIHDTAHITGYVPEGYCVKFEYWQQNDGDVSNDKLLTTTDCVTVPAGATSVDSPEITADKEGTFYWREQLIPVKPEQPTGPDSDKPNKPTTPVTYGKPRVPDETVSVHPLASTGVGADLFAGLGLLLLGAGTVMGLAGAKRRRRMIGRHSA